LYDYHERITNLQYLPSEKEIEFLCKHIPVQIAGDPSEKIEVKALPFEGKTFVLTGAMDAFTRDEARRIIEDRGGRVASSVSKNTDFVVVGSEPGSKYDKAVGLGIEILNEDAFKRMIEAL